MIYNDMKPKKQFINWFNCRKNGVPAYMRDRHTLVYPVEHVELAGMIIHEVIMVELGWA